eukprot:746178-Hanusia_phi.AAC.4
MASGREPGRGRGRTEKMACRIKSGLKDHGILNGDAKWSKTCEGDQDLEKTTGKERQGQTYRASLICWTNKAVRYKRFESPLQKTPIPPRSWETCFVVPSSSISQDATLSKAERKALWEAQNAQKAGEKQKLSKAERREIQEKQRAAKTGTEEPEVAAVHECVLQQAAAAKQKEAAPKPVKSENQTPNVQSAKSAQQVRALGERRQACVLMLRPGRHRVGERAGQGKCWNKVAARRS